MQFPKWLYLLVSLIALLPCAAIAKSTPAFGNKHGNRTPIDVTSDSLEVLQDQNKAIFTGHVVAIQDTVRLKADKMTVYYAKGGDKGDTSKKTKAKGGQAETGAIKKIETEGNVFLSTPEETASGATGVYDVEHQEIRLNDHVVLTRGQNVLKGDRLVYNFETGKSKLMSGSETTQSGGKGRVHALFVPENKEGEKK